MSDYALRSMLRTLAQQRHNEGSRDSGHVYWTGMEYRRYPFTTCRDAMCIAVERLLSAPPEPAPDDTVEEHDAPVGGLRERIDHAIETAENDPLSGQDRAVIRDVLLEARALAATTSSVDFNVVPSRYHSCAKHYPCEACVVGLWCDEHDGVRPVTTSSADA